MKPNFTGTWKFNHAKSKLEIAAPDASIFVIDHRDPMFRISRTHIAGERRDTFSLDLTTDGRTVLANLGELRLRSSAHWDGNALVFDTSFTKSGEDATNSVRYSQFDDGRSLLAEEAFRSHSMNYDNVWVLDRIEQDSDA